MLPMEGMVERVEMLVVDLGMVIVRVVWTYS